MTGLAVLCDDGPLRDGGRAVPGSEIQGFDEWYMRVRPKLIAVLAASGLDLDAAQDAVDEALTRAFERWDDVCAMANPDGWTYVVARNIARTALRRASIAERVRQMRRDDVELPDTLVEFRLLLEPLSPQNRHIVVLRHVFGMTEPEIADALGMNRGTVSSRLRRSHARLRATLPMLMFFWGWT